MEAAEELQLLIKQQKQDRDGTFDFRQQYFFNEIPVEDKQLFNYSEDDSIALILGTTDESSVLSKQTLYRLILSIIEAHLTEHQQAIIKLYFDGNTQQEIADTLSITQSAVTKSLYGNLDYTRTSVMLYGGSIPRLQKLCSTNKLIQRLMKQINPYYKPPKYQYKYTIRRKQVREIKAKYSTGLYSFRDLALKYSVSAHFLDRILKDVEEVALRKQREPVEATKRSTLVNKAYYKVYFPSGDVEIVFGIAEFCRKYGLHTGSMVGRGKNKGFGCERIGPKRLLKVDDNTRQEIRDKYKTNIYTQQQLADEYLVCKETIIAIVNEFVDKETIKKEIIEKYNTGNYTYAQLSAEYLIPIVTLGRYVRKARET